MLQEYNSTVTTLQPGAFAKQNHGEWMMFSQPHWPELANPFSIAQSIVSARENDPNIKQQTQSQTVCIEQQIQPIQEQERVYQQQYLKTKCR